MNCDLEAASGDERRGLGITTPLNKIRSVKTIARVAHELTRDEAWLGYMATGMEPEDGLIWVCGIAEGEVMAFSEDGVANLENLIEICRQLA